MGQIVEFLQLPIVMSCVLGWTLKFNHKIIRQHLSMCLENHCMSRFPVLGERRADSKVKSSQEVDLHCSCHMPESSLQNVMDAASGSISTARTYPVKCLMMHKMSIGCAMIVVPVKESVIQLYHPWPICNTKPVNM